MKKTYDVYSIFGKTCMTASMKVLMFMFVFSVCLLGVTSEASAQTFNTNPNNIVVNGQSGQADATFLKSFQFDDSTKEDAVELLRSEMLNLIQNPVNDGPYEADYGARVYYLENLVANLVGTDVPIADATAQTYGTLVRYVTTNLSVAVDTEEIASYYSSLIDL